jgi:ABC-2 type transport system permease protein
MKSMGRLLRFFKDSSHIAVKDLKDFARDRARIVSFLIMPIFMMLLTGFIFPSQSALKNIPIGLVNQDGGAISTAMIEQLKILTPEGSSTPVMALKPMTDEEEVKEKIKEQVLSGAIIFPAGFSDGLVDGQAQSVIMVTDQSNPQISSLMTGMMEKVFDGMGKQMAEEQIQEKVQEMTGTQLPPERVAALVNPLIVESVGIVPGKPNYFQFVAPGVMAMVTMMAVMMGLAGSITREKEQGTLDGLLVSPVSRVSIIMGKTESQTVRGLAQGAIILLLSMTIFGVKVYGSFPLMIFILILGVFSFVGIGILVSAAVEEQETAMTIMMTITFPMMFLSGAFFPLQQMPGAMQAISKAIPLTYEVEALRQVMVLGAGIGEVIKPMLALIAFGVVTLAISIPAFKRVVTR